jgi:hypothetical protein
MFEMLHSVLSVISLIVFMKNLEADTLAFYLQRSDRQATSAYLFATSAALVERLPQLDAVHAALRP